MKKNFEFHKILLCKQDEPSFVALMKLGREGKSLIQRSERS